MKDELNSFTPIFIIGVGRSGTTLLQSILNAHPKICFPPETHFVKNYFRINKEDMENFLVFKKRIFSDESIKRIPIDINKILYKARTGKLISKKMFYYYLLQEVKNQEKKEFVGDKDPKNIEHI
ncbi:unnamed protein product, partial [marine sediment metagenome]